MQAGRHAVHSACLVAATANAVAPELMPEVPSACVPSMLAHRLVMSQSAMLCCVSLASLT
jgi:hypothetical protein